MTANKNSKTSETKTPNISSCKYTISDMKDKELQALTNFLPFFPRKTIALLRLRHVIQTFLFAMPFNCLNYRNYLSRFASKWNEQSCRHKTWKTSSTFFPRKFMLENNLTEGTNRATICYSVSVCMLTSVVARNQLRPRKTRSKSS